MATLAQAAREDGLEHDFEAALALAKDGRDVAAIEGMMRGMFSRDEIRAMIAHARSTATMRS